MDVQASSAVLVARADPDQASSDAAWQRFRRHLGDAIGSVDKALLELPSTMPPRAQEPLPALRSRTMTDREGRQFRALELVTDASALLWRLDLLGVDVGARWNLLADRWEAMAPLGDYAFDAWLAMMAFVGAGRERSQRQTLITLKVISLGSGEAAFFAKECGMAAAQAILAFGAGRYAETVDLLRPLRRCAHRFGGRPGRRDLIDLTLIEAALRSGQEAIASALVGERAARRLPGAHALHKERA